MPSKNKDNLEIISRDLLKKLVSNNEDKRETAFKTVTQLISTKHKINKTQMLKVWKGLWYLMWQSDTPLVQQKLAGELAELGLKVHSRNTSIFFECFYSIAMIEWVTLDRYRINKFYMLVRFMLNAQLSLLQNVKQTNEFIDFMLNEEFGPLSYGNDRLSHSLRLHIIDIYLDEVEKAVKKKEIIELIVKPLISQLEFSKFKHIKAKVKTDVMCDGRLAEWGIVEEKPKFVVKHESDESEFEGFD